MDSITLFYFIKILSFAIFLIIGIFLFIEFLRKKNNINILFFSICFLIFAVNLFNFFKYPSISESRNYINDFKNLKIEEIKEINIKTYIIDSKPTKINKVIKRDSIINNIVNVLKRYNKTSSYSFKDWNPTIAYKIYIKSENERIFIFDIIETETDLSVVNLIYYNKQSLHQIGQYANNNIGKLKIYTLGL